MDGPNEKYPDEGLQEDGNDRVQSRKRDGASTTAKYNLTDRSEKHDPKFALHSVLYPFKSERFPFLVSFVTLPVSILCPEVHSQRQR